jgi:exodeoxyribonuclease-3
MTELAAGSKKPNNRGEHGRSVIVGDFNVAPLETDVWSHKQLLDVVSHTPIEVEHLERLRAAEDWLDAVRHFIPPEQKLYSWWSYRARDWRSSDRGRRLDHIWVTRPLTSALRGTQILKDARDWTPPSDHVPVVVDIEP